MTLPLGDAPPLGWGVVGPGRMAATFAGSLRRSGFGELRRVVGRDADRSAAFCETHGGRAAADLAELLADDTVQAVYVATPPAAHAATVAAALDAGRAVLCEKPMTTQPMQTAALVSRSRALGVPLLEGWMYRHHPQWARLLQLIRDGAVGRVSRCRAIFAFSVEPADEPLLFDPDLGGGAILTVGGYPLSAAMSIAAAAAGVESSWLAPHVEAGIGALSDRGVDMNAEALLSFEDGLQAFCATSIRHDHGVSVEVAGEHGTIALRHPFVPEGRREGTAGHLVITRGDDVTVEEPVASHDVFALEAAAMARLVHAGDLLPPAPLVGLDESFTLAMAMEAWRSHVARGVDAGQGEARP